MLRIEIIIFIFLVIFLVILLKTKNEMDILNESKSIEELNNITDIYNCEIIIIELITLIESMSIIKKSITRNTKIFYYEKDRLENNSYIDILKNLNIRFTPCKISIDNNKNRIIYDLDGF